MEESFRNVQALTFDAFGTVLDLGGSLIPPIAAWIASRDLPLDAARMWDQWRARQRIEQYQDSLLLMGHTGYTAAVRRALLYVLRLNKVPFTAADLQELMEAWQHLRPFPDVLDALNRLRERFNLVVLSNGELPYLRHLVQNQIRFNFYDVISVDSVGVFKPHPSVYRYAARHLGLEPCQVGMVSANSFDVMGARASGNRAVWVHRYDLPYEESPFQPDLVVPDFGAMADRLL